MKSTREKCHAFFFVFEDFPYEKYPFFLIRVLALLSSPILEYSRFGSYRLFHHYTYVYLKPDQTPTNITDVIWLNDQ